MRKHTDTWQHRKDETFENAVRCEPGTYLLISRILSLGLQRFHHCASDITKRHLLTVHTVAEIQVLLDRIDSVSTWDELFADTAKE